MKSEKGTSFIFPKKPLDYFDLVLVSAIAVAMYVLIAKIGHIDLLLLTVAVVTSIIFKAATRELWYHVEVWSLKKIYGDKMDVLIQDIQQVLKKDIEDLQETKGKKDEDNKEDVR